MNYYTLTRHHKHLLKEKITDVADPEHFQKFWRKEKLHPISIEAIYKQTSWHSRESGIGSQVDAEVLENTRLNWLCDEDRKYLRNKTQDTAQLGFGVLTLIFPSAVPQR